jgi:hypothetical protein
MPYEWKERQCSTDQGTSSFTRVVPSNVRNRSRAAHVEDYHWAEWDATSAMAHERRLGAVVYPLAGALSRRRDVGGTFGGAV